MDDRHASNQVVKIHHKRKGECAYYNGHHRQGSNSNGFTCRDFCHWLIDHGLSRTEIDGSLQKPYLICVFKRALNVVMLIEV